MVALNGSASLNDIVTTLKQAIFDAVVAGKITRLRGQDIKITSESNKDNLFKQVYELYSVDIHKFQHELFEDLKEYEPHRFVFLKLDTEERETIRVAVYVKALEIDRQSGRYYEKFINGFNMRVAE